MDGPSHYRAAERLIEKAERQFGDSRADEPNPIYLLTITEAQVHATLAHAAATIQTLNRRVDSQWTEALT